MTHNEPSKDNMSDEPVNKKPRRAYRLEDRKADYERWWLNKLVAEPWDGGGVIGRVVKIEVFGPPSGFTCVARITFDNGPQRNLVGGPNGFRANKSELRVIAE